MAHNKTNIPSQISFRGELANISANDPRNTLNGETNVYIDDFEGLKLILILKDLMHGIFRVSQLMGFKALIQKVLKVVMLALNLHGTLLIKFLF